VLAHFLSQINVRAGVGLHLIDSQPAPLAPNPTAPGCQRWWNPPARRNST
jgi:hypothetical protein